MSFVYAYGLYIAVAASLIIALAALIYALLMHRRVNRIFKNAHVPDIEALLMRHSGTVDDLLTFQKEAVNYMTSLNRRIEQKLARARTIRFNPFQGEGIGGNQSFVSVFADEKGNGVVITSMHTRERTNVFAKPLTEWKSEYELGDEEKATIEQAKANE